MKRLKLEKSIRLESGQTLHNPQIVYHTYGKLNAKKSNVVWVCHALSANSDVFDWWKGLFGNGNLFNPEDHFIVCANFLGSHYGTTGPLSINQETDTPYYGDFPEITVRDMVSLHFELMKFLAIEKIAFLIGGSMGGHQALEMAISKPNSIDELCLLATSAVISPWASALNQSQRMAIACDPTWGDKNNNAAQNGMSVARSIALLSYRNQGAYNTTQKENLRETIYPSKAASYQEYQGKKITQRFNAYSYWHISKAMDSHNIARNRDTLENVLASIKAKTLILSFENDLLFPYEDQQILYNHIPNAQLKIIPTKYGHDGFLIETGTISKVIEKFSSIVNFNVPEFA